MAGIFYYAAPPCQISAAAPMAMKVEERIQFQCRFSSPDTRKRETQTPKIVKLAVAGVTQILRFFTPDDRDRLKLGNDRGEDETKVSNMDDVLLIIRTDYENAYFVTGLFTSTIYADDCIFEDPTIKFQGRDLYSRNLKLLVPFFDSPSIELKKIEKGVTPDTIIALWKLRTYLKLPWRPLISVDGSTIYELDENLKIVRHVESWSISALEALGQIFTPTFLEKSFLTASTTNTTPSQLSSQGDLMEQPLVWFSGEHDMV